jgi:hypothetical protein
MPRAENVFFNLVTDENSTTELLCNLMRFSAFRTPFLRQFLSETVASEVTGDDFDTQVDLGACGRPDLRIRNKDLVALIEVKVTTGLSLTANQPAGYAEFLTKQNAPERWLVFLVPKLWIPLDGLKKSLSTIVNSVHTHIIHWEDVTEIIETNDLGALNPFLNDFYKLLMARIAPKSVVFTTKEIVMLFTKEIPAALSRLQQVVDGVRDRSTTYKVKPSSSRSLCPSEYGMYFHDTQDRVVLWFGVWTDFWESNGTPLCFGVTENSSEAVRQAFLATFKGQTKHFDKYILGWFGQEILTTEDIVDQVWAQLSPLVEATVAASSQEPGPNSDAAQTAGPLA